MRKISVRNRKSLKESENANYFETKKTVLPKIDQTKTEDNNSCSLNVSFCIECNKRDFEDKKKKNTKDDKHDGINVCKTRDKKANGTLMKNTEYTDVEYCISIG